MKKIIILGATSGIGKELARVYAKTEAEVLIAGRRTVLLQELAEESDKYNQKTFDITQTDLLEPTLDEWAEELGHIDLFIINSGVGRQNAALDFAVEQPIIATNVHGFTCACDWAMKFFQKQGYGHLLAITSVAGLRGNRFAPAYSASKAYQMKYLQGMRQTVANWKLPIYITDVRPGFVDTAMAPENGTFWVATPEVAAKQIYRAIEKRKRIVYVTKRWKWAAMVFKALPEFIYNRF